jgi:hypothetical protein
MGRRYKFVSAPVSAPGLLLDIYTGAAAAYSNRLLRTAYSGPCLRVRRDTDSSEMDIGFVAGVIDNATLGAFIGPNQGLVVKRYDQSGNGNDLVQTNASKQISCNHSYFINGKSVVFHQAAERGLNLTTPVTIHSIFSVFQNTAFTALNYHIASSGKGLFTGGTAAGGLGIGIYDGFHDIGSGIVISTVYDTNPHAVGITTDSVNGKMIIDGGTPITGLLTPFSIDTVGFRPDATSLGLVGKDAEIILYANDMGSQSHDIVTEQKTYYGI